MNLDQAMSNIESEEFAYKSFIIERIDQLADLLKCDDSFKTIESSLLRSDEVYKRALELAYKVTDEGVRHPDDVALFSYLLFLQSADILRANVLAEIIVRLGNCWWSRRLATRMLEKKQAVSSTNYVINLVSGLKSELKYDLSFDVDGGKSQPSNLWTIPVSSGFSGRIM